MSTSLDALLAEIQIAAAKPDGMTLLAVDQLTSGQPDLRHALESAAVPHWWDDAILARLLPEDLAAEAPQWADKLRALSVVEPYLARPQASNVHEVTRQALRAQLHREGRLQEASARALSAFASSAKSAATTDILEHLFHSLSADPAGAENLEQTWRIWTDQGRWRDLLDLAAILEEALPTLTGQARACAQFCHADIRFDHQPASSLLDAVEESLQIFVKFQDVRSQAQAANLLGDILRWHGQTGDAERALEQYQRSLQLREALHSANPDSAQAARDVSVSLERLGDFLCERGQTGDAERALEHYQRSLQLREALHSPIPDSALAARDISVSLERLGDFLHVRGQTGDAERALEHYQRSLQLSEALHSANPDSALAARDVSVSLIKLGDFLRERGQTGDAERALEHYQRSLQLSEALHCANPDSAQAARDFSVSLNKLGDFLRGRGQTGDAERALEHYQRSLQLSEALLSANPDSAQAARDVSVNLDRLGDFLRKRDQTDDAERALEHYLRSLQFREALHSANPDSAQAARDVSVSLIKLGDFLRVRGQTGDAERALELYQRSLQLREALHSANPDSAQAARDMYVSYWKLAQHAEATGMTEQARQYWQQTLTLMQGLKDRSGSLSVQDEHSLDWLREKGP